MSAEKANVLGRKPLVVRKEDVEHLPFLERAAARVAIRRGDWVLAEDCTADAT